MTTRFMLAIAVTLLTGALYACDGEPVQARVATTVAPEAGGDQVGMVGTPVGDPLVVQVMDQNGRPMSGATVTWQTDDGGSFEPGTSQTDVLGQASTIWTLGPTAGAQVARAEVGGLSPVTFPAAAEPGVAAIVTMEQDTVTMDAIGDQHPLTAEVTDQFGNPIPDEGALEWASLDPSVATVAGDGVVTAAGVGVTRIVVSLDAAADTAVVVARETVDEAGGVVEADGGAVQLVIPAGAVPAGTPIGVEAVEPGDLPAGTDHVGTAYRFSPSGATFSEPVALTFSYDRGELPPGEAESRLVARTLVDGEWNQVAETSVDMAAEEVTATLSGFSVYGVGFGPAYTHVTAGSQHACGLDEDGAAFCWGGNADGQLGTGDDASTATPVPVAGGIRFAALEAVDFHTCGLDEGGRAYCWGRNTGGQLGDGTLASRSEPTPVSGGHTFESLAVGGFHACGRTAGGDVLCWGRNHHGQIGAESTDECAFGSGATPCNPAPTAVAGDVSFATVVTGFNHTCGLTGAGAAYCWGWNAFGAIGDDTTDDRAVPTAVHGGLTFSNIAAGVAQTCGIANGGAAYCWGNNFFGNIGNGQLTGQARVPTEVLGGHAFTELAISKENNIFTHACGLTPDGSAYCWGPNDRGQLGTDATAEVCNSVAAPGDFGCTSTPVRVDGPRAYQSLGVAARYMCGTKASGEAWCWGINNFGQQGNGAVLDVLDSDPASRLLFPWETPADHGVAPSLRGFPDPGQLQVQR